MYIGTPSQVIDGLPSLINNIKMMYAIARYYGTNERMTRLFFKITNQMVTLCKEHILEDGPNLWAHDKERLIGKLNLSIALHDAYKQQYGIVPGSARGAETEAETVRLQPRTGVWEARRVREEMR